MTEQILDALRPLAVTIEDEGSRLRRSLKGSSANEEQVREHLRNCLKACEAAEAALNPVSTSIEFERKMDELSSVLKAVGENIEAVGRNLEVTGVDLADGLGKATTATFQPPPRKPRK